MYIVSKYDNKDMVAYNSYMKMYVTPTTHLPKVHLNISINMNHFMFLRLLRMFLNYLPNRAFF